MAEHRIPSGEKKRWLDHPHNVEKIYWAVVVACAGLFLADAFYHKHPSFGMESIFGFYGLFGFVACVALVLAAKQMRKLIMRPEDFYDAPAASAGDEGKGDAAPDRGDSH